MTHCLPRGRLRAFVLAFAVLAFAALAPHGCSQDGKGTTLVVSVASDLTVGTDIDAVKVVIEGGQLEYPFALGAGSGRTSLPVRVALVPAHETNKRFRVQAVGLFQGVPSVSQAAVVSFVPGMAQEITLFLGRACLGVAACPASQTCEHGTCVSEDTAGMRKLGGSADAGTTDSGAGGTIGAGGGPGTGGSGTDGGRAGAGGSGTGGAGTGRGGAGGAGGGGAGGAGTGRGGAGGGAGGTGGAGTGGAAGGTGRVLFFDDFEGGAAKWIATTTGDWTVVTDGTMVYKQGTLVSTPRIAAAGDAAWTDIIVEAKVKVLEFAGQSTAYRAGVCARFLDVNNYYCAVFNPVQFGTLAIRGRAAGSDFTIASEAIAGGTNVFRTIGLRVVGSTLTAYLDGTLVLTGTDANVPSGGIAVMTNNATAEFDDVKVTAP